VNSKRLLTLIIVSTAYGVSFNAALAQNSSSRPIYNVRYDDQSEQCAPKSNQYHHGQVAYAPQGMVLPIRLTTGISTEVAQAGDPIQARLSQDMNLGSAVIPAGSTVSGQITQATAAGRMGHSGHLGIKFTNLSTPDGANYPINAHLVGGIDKYHQTGAENSDQFQGENGWTKLKDVGLRGAVGAGGGAVLGTAVGGIAGGGRGAGRGAWSGTAIGAGLGVADSLLVRKGKQINIKGGTEMQIQLDSPVSIASNTKRTY
jgi:hypothetical protein